MKRILVALMLLASTAGCRVSGDFGISAAKKERPTVNVPEVLRQTQLDRRPGHGVLRSRHHDFASSAGSTG